MLRLIRKSLLVSSLSVSTQLWAAAPQETEQSFQLRDPKTREVYFTGVEKVSEEGGLVRRETVTFDSAKKEVQKISLAFETGSLRTSSYQSVNALTGEESQLTPNEKGYELSYKPAGKKETGKFQIKPEAYLPGTAIDLILANWDKLIAGKSLRFSLIMPARAELVPFQLVRRESVTRDGEAREVFTLMPQSQLIRTLAPHFEFQFNKDKKIRAAVIPSSLPIKGSRDKMVEMIFQ